MEVINRMQTPLMKKCVRSDELPIAWQKEINAQPKQLFTITINVVEEIDYDVDGTLMPPESQINAKLIEAVEASEASYKKGNFTSFDNTDELFQHLDSL